MTIIDKNTAQPETLYVGIEKSVIVQKIWIQPSEIVEYL
jgi:hypothetical protein